MRKRSFVAASLEPVRSRSHGGRSLGQSLVEFAVVLPVMLLLLLVGLDFGRVFLGWVNLNNSVRVAANFAAMNPNAWANGNATVTDQYQALVTQDAATTNCALPTPVPTPAFPNGTDIGDPAQVTITCNFSIITPIIGNIVGHALPVSASAAFPIRAGAIAGIPVETVVPTPTPMPTPTATPTPTPTPTATPTPTPTPMCTVPDLANVNTQNAQYYWGAGHTGNGHGGDPGNITGAGFQSSVVFNPAVGNGNGNNYTITHQSIAAGTSLPCDASTVITVSP